MSWEQLLLAVVLGGALAWYLTSTAARLDRLHHKVDVARAALDAQLVRRATAALELAGSGLLDTAESLLLAGAAADALDAPDAPDGERERAESDLSEALRLAVGDPAEVGRVAADPRGAVLLEQVSAAAHRARLARRFHNEAVTQALRLRGKRVVRWARLAGRSSAPRTFEADDAGPGTARGPA